MHSTPSDLTRRRFLVSGAALATTLQLQPSALVPPPTACKLIAEQEEGPYYVAGELLRSNLIEGKPGIPLSLRILVLDARTCQPLANAAVDLWHCDALGLYSGFTKQNPIGPQGSSGPGGPNGLGHDQRPRDFSHQPPEGPPPGFNDPGFGNHPGAPGSMGAPPHSRPSDKLTFLRGIQLTGTDGCVTFQTVFPGFYMGRTNHIHLKVRVGGQVSGHSYAAGHASHTGQIFFPEQVAVQLMQHEPYSLHTIQRTTQAEDHVYGDQHGESALVQLRFVQPGHFAAGMHADFVASVDPSTTPATAQRRAGPVGPPPGMEQD